jgi:hypothetical protein
MYVDDLLGRRQKDPKICISFPAIAERMSDFASKGYAVFRALKPLGMLLD